MVQQNNQGKNRIKQGGILRESLPEKASSLASCLDDLKTKWQKKPGIAGLWQDWPIVAGSQLAKNCRPLSFHRGVLVVGASHPQWLQALQYNRSQLIASLRAAGHKIRDLRIQKYHPSKTKHEESLESIWARHPSRIDVHGLTTCNLCGSPAPTGEMALWGKCGFCKRKNISTYPTKTKFGESP